MPKLFASSTTQKCDVLDGERNAIQLDLTQHYVFKSPVGHPEKTLNSLITLKMEDGKIVHHEEQWDHEKNTTSDDGFLGTLQEFRKTITAKIIHAAVSSDPKKI